MAVAFPDEGAWKRFHEDLSQWPVITCVKVREGEKRVVSIKDGEARAWVKLSMSISLHCPGAPRGCHVVIVDDLVQTGGTLLQCAKVTGGWGVGVAISSLCMYRHSSLLGQLPSVCLSSILCSQRSHGAGSQQDSVKCSLPTCG